MSLKFEELKNSVQKVIEKIKKTNTRNACQSFVSITFLGYSESTLINLAPSLNQTLVKFEDVDLDTLSLDEVILICDDNRNETLVALRLFSFLYKNDLCRLFICNRDMFFFLVQSPDYQYIRKVIRDKTIIERTIYISNEEKLYSKIIVPVGNVYVSKLLTDYALQRKSKQRDLYFLQVLSRFFVKYKINNIDESICDKLIELFFEENMDMDSYSFSQSKRFFIWVITRLSKSQRLERCPLYRLEMLSKQTFSVEFRAGCRPVKYSKFDKIPAFDNWMLIPNLEEISKSTLVSETCIFSFRFGRIINKQFRMLVKTYIWNSNISLYSKYNVLFKLVLFCNMFYPNENRIYSFIDSSVLARYKSYVLSTYSSLETRFGFISDIREFIRYLERNELIGIDSHCYFFLTMKGSKHKIGAKGLSVEHLSLLAEFLNEHKYESLDSLIFYVIFHISNNTELRISQICELQIDCVHESMKKKEYAIRSVTKVSAGSIVEQPCSSILKRIIDDYLIETASFRDSIPDKSLKKYLFIRTKSNKLSYMVVTTEMFRDYIAKVCKLLGISKVRPKNIRATYLTNAKEYVIRNKLSDATLLGISGHRNIDTVNNHYIEEKIRDSLEATNNIIIGKIDIQGIVTRSPNSIITDKKNAVEEECGFCQSDFCDLNGPLTCLLCSKFATTVDRIPFFEKHIKGFDKSIEVAQSRHDVEDIVNLKRLFARYLEELLKLKELSNYEANH